MNLKHRLVRSGTSILLGMSALVLFIAFVRAQGNSATVSVVPASQDVDTQASYALTITLEGAQDLGAFEFDLGFDPALLQVDDVTLGDFLGSTGRNTAELGPNISNDTGIVTYGAFSFGAQGGPDGAGVLAIVSFTTFITEGVSDLNLQSVQIINTQAQTQTVTAVGGSVAVLAGPRIGSPDFESSVSSNDPLIVTVPITNTTSDTGVSTATLHYGYTFPYTQSLILGSSPGGNGDGLWPFSIPPQDASHEGQTL